MGCIKREKSEIKNSFKLLKKNSFKKKKKKKNTHIVIRSPSYNATLLLQFLKP